MARRRSTLLFYTVGAAKARRTVLLSAHSSAGGLWVRSALAAVSRPPAVTARRQGAAAFVRAAATYRDARTRDDCSRGRAGEDCSRDHLLFFERRDCMPVVAEIEENLLCVLA